MGPRIFGARQLAYYASKLELNNTQANATLNCSILGLSSSSSSTINQLIFWFS